MYSFRKEKNLIIIIDGENKKIKKTSFYYYLNKLRNSKIYD